METEANPSQNDGPLERFPVLKTRLLAPGSQRLPGVTKQVEAGLGPQPAGMGTNMLSRISFTSAITGPDNLPEYVRVTQEVIIVLLSHSLCPTLRPHGLYSLPGSSVQGIFQARILEWVAISSSGESSLPRDQTHVSCGSALMGRFFATEPPGSPHSESERI